MGIDILITEATLLMHEVSERMHETTDRTEHAKLAEMLTTLVLHKAFFQSTKTIRSNA